MPIISNMQSADIEATSPLHLSKAAQLRMNGEVCEFFSFEVELSHKDPSQWWVNLVSLSAAFMKFSPFPCHIVRLKQALKILEYIPYDVSEQLWFTRPTKLYSVFVEVCIWDRLQIPQTKVWLAKARKLQGEVISCHPTKKLCSRCWNGSAFHLWFCCSSHTHSMSGTAFCTGVLSYNSLFENNCLSRIWPSVWSTLDRVVNDTLGLFPPGKTEEISPACLPPNPSRAVS